MQLKNIMTSISISAAKNAPIEIRIIIGTEVVIRVIESAANADTIVPTVPAKR